MEYNAGLKVSGYYKLWVVNEDGTSTLKCEGPNLILNQGLDSMVDYTTGRLNHVAHAGNGNRVNKIFSGDSSGSVSNGWFYLYPGTTGLQNFSSSWRNFTASYGYTSSLTVGDMIKFADGTEVMISGSYSGSNVTYNLSRNFIQTASVSDFSASIKPGGPTLVDTQSFIIYKTHQRGLQNTTKRAGSGVSTSSYLTDPGGCGFHYSSSECWTQNWRTYNFSSESVDIIYSELGVGYSTANTDIFSRIVLPVTVSVSSTQALRLRHDLYIQYNPTSSIGVLNAPISGWPVAPSTNTNLSYSIQNFFSSFFVRTTSAGGYTPGFVGDNASMELDYPSLKGWASGNSQSLAAPSTFVNRSLLSNGLAEYSDFSLDEIAYVPWSFEYIKYKEFSFNEINANNISSMGIGQQDNSPAYNPLGNGQIFTIVFEQTQSKTNTETLTLYFKWNWNRTLSD